ncbi:MAG: DUF2892 domain-containing protein [Terriglobales bacterium]
MRVERGLRLMAGTFILVSMALAHYVSEYWYLLTAFVGLNLFQSGITNWCPAMVILRKLGLRDESHIAKSLRTDSTSAAGR